MKYKKLIISGTLVIIIICAVITLKIKSNPKTIVHTPVIVDLSQFKNGEEIFISPKSLLERSSEKNLVILDASHPKVYKKGHIPGAVNIGFKGLSNCTGKPGDKKWGTILEKKLLTKKLESLGINNDSFVVAYSDIFKGPGACGRAVWQMKMAGLKNVKLLYGGFELWKRSGYDISKQIVKPKPSTGLTLNQYDETYNADQEYIFNNLDSLKIIDVRSLKEYTGKDTSRGEARGGHIKGAKFIEWKSFLKEDSTLKPTKDIELLLAEKGIKPEDNFVLY